MYSICPIFSKGHAEIFREFYHDFMFTIAVFFVSNSQRIFFFRGNWSNVQCVCLNLNVAMLFSSEATVKNLSKDRPLSLPEYRLTYVPANSGTPYVLFSAKVMLKFSVNFSMTLLKIGHMGYLRLMHGRGILVLS